MTFANLATGDAVFVDANTLIHLFQPHPKWGQFCHQLIQRIDNQDLLGFTSTHVISEASHRLMTGPSPASAISSAATRTRSRS